MTKSVTKTPSAVFEVIASDLTYLPNPQQRRLKESFWVRWQENPVCDAKDISLAMAQRLVGDSRLDKWWGQSGFKEWFRNQEEFRERASALAHLALDVIESVLIDQNSGAAARVSAAKLAFELARKMPQKVEQVKYLDESINKMDKKQLEAYLTRNRHLLPSNDLTPIEDSDTLDTDPTESSLS